MLESGVAVLGFVRRNVSRLLLILIVALPCLAKDKLKDDPAWQKRVAFAAALNQKMNLSGYPTMIVSVEGKKHDILNLNLHLCVNILYHPAHYETLFGTQVLIQGYWDTDCGRWDPSDMLRLKANQIDPEKNVLLDLGFNAVGFSGLMKTPTTSSYIEFELKK